MERRLIAEYETLVGVLTLGLTPDRLAISVELASLPERIRGFGHVKERNIRLAEAEKLRLLERLDAPAARLAAD